MRDEQIIVRARDAFANAIEELLSHGHHLVGLAGVRDAKRVSVVLAIAAVEARLEPGTRRVDASRHVTRGGELFLAAVAPTHDAMAWVESAIERPIGRTALLDPGARVIAVGPSIPEGLPGLGAALTTYSLFGAEGHGADEDLFFRRIAQARAVRRSHVTEERPVAAWPPRGSCCSPSCVWDERFAGRAHSLPLDGESRRATDKAFPHGSRAAFCPP